MAVLYFHNYYNSPTIHHDLLKVMEMQSAWHPNTFSPHYFSFLISCTTYERLVQTYGPNQVQSVVITNSRLEACEHSVQTISTSKNVFTPPTLVHTADSSPVPPKYTIINFWLAFLFIRSARPIGGIYHLDENINRKNNMQGCCKWCCSLWVCISLHTHFF